MSSTIILVLWHTSRAHGSDVLEGPPLRKSRVLFSSWTVFINEITRLAWIRRTHTIYQKWMCTSTNALRTWTRPQMSASMPGWDALPALRTRCTLQHFACSYISWYSYGTSILLRVESLTWRSKWNTHASVISGACDIQRRRAFPKCE